MKLAGLPLMYQKEAEKRQRLWGKILYLAFLGGLLVTAAWWLGRGVLFLEIPALVDGREFLVQSTEAGRLEKVTVAVGDTVGPDMVVARVDVTRRLTGNWPPDMVFKIEEVLQRLSGDAEVTARELSLKGGLAREKELLEEVYRRHQPPAGKVVTELRVPLEGVVISQNRQLGEVVLPAQPVLTLIDPQDLYIKTFVEEKNQDQVGLGQEAAVLFPDGSRLQGRVKKLYPASEPLPPEYQDYHLRRQRALVAEIAADGAEPGKMVYGMRVKVRLNRTRW